MVLPSIRKNGGYIAGQEELSPQELMAKALLVAQKTLTDRDARKQASGGEVIAICGRKGRYLVCLVSARCPSPFLPASM